ncbi:MULTISPECIES: transglutaminase-like domain-containing protein [unclassified Pseudonocardia]|uniref:transglutaminase-like domain-containing protein n=1 Tax=unclassified Pseudonocardia TaxID=2619320 RepID=UPI00201668F2|nr:MULTISPECIES: transglutaminase-like domain-containing protein [unclassified Pseudonocardia]
MTAGLDDPRARAAALFEAVRDEIWYDPFCVVTDPEAYRASRVAGQQGNWCVPKAVLLTAAARAAGIPARPGSASPTSATTSTPRGCGTGWAGRTCSSGTATPRCGSTAPGARPPRRSTPSCAPASASSRSRSTAPATP